MTELPVIGERIRLLRVRKNMTQADLANGLCTGSMISQIETGKARPSYHVLEQIAQRLDVPLEFLLEDREVNLEYIASYRSAQMLMGGQDFHGAKEVLKQLLNSARGQHDGVPLLGDLIECYLRTDRMAEAERLIELLEREAEAYGDDRLWANMAKHRGVIAFQGSCYQRAIYQWEQALERLSQTEVQERYLYADLLFRIAQAYAKLGDVERSLLYCERSAPFFEHAKTLGDQARTCLSLSKTFRTSSDLRAASAFAKRAQHLYSVLQHRAMGERNRASRALVLPLVGRAERAQGEISAAMRRLQEIGCLEEAGLLAMELARVHLQASDVDAADHACHKALRWIPTTHKVRLKLQALVGRIEAKCKKRQEGVQRIQQVVATHQEQGEVFAWEEAVSDLAWVYADEEDYREACDLLLNARTYSRDCLQAKGVRL